MNEQRVEILFVNRNAEILAKLKTLLNDEKWLCRFVDSRTSADKILARGGTNLIVSDGEPDGTADGDFLSRVRDRHPQVVRMLLTEKADRKNIVKALAEGDTQQIIPVPWVDQEVKEILRSALRQQQQQRKHSAGFQALINSAPLMPALPESYSNVRSCITADEIDIEKMADYIVQDVSISSTLLHWANSALFGQRFQVDTIKKAIIVLGTDIVENLILSESVNKTIAGKRPDIKGFDFQQFKKHSMATAVIARLLIKSVHSSDAVKHDRAFISGLLHDMGKLAMASFFPRQFEDAISTARKKSCALLDAEQETCGSNHAEVGAFLAEWWTLPPFIVNAICWHHAPQATPVDQDIIAATHVANLLSYQFHYGSGAEVPDRPIEERYGEMFYLNDEALEYIRTKTEKTIMKLVR